MCCPDILNFEQTINICDFALYQAKEHGRDCSVHISLATSDCKNIDELKKYLTTLTKESVINNNFISIKYICAN
jgi:hypothetical protein